MRRILLCSTAVPWPNRPLLGIFHIHQAQALRALGVEMALFSPSVAVPTWLGRAWPRLRDHAARPARYQIDGVEVFAPRTRFVFPAFVRQRLVVARPDAVLRHADRRLARALDATIARFEPDLLLGHGLVPWGDAIANAASRFGIDHAFIEHSAGDVTRVQPGSPLARALGDRARRARAVFVVGPQMLEHASTVLGWPNVVLLPNGALRAAPGERGSDAARRRTVLAPANYSRRKGFEELVEAFGAIAAKHADVELQLVTAAPDSLRALIAASPAKDRIAIRPPVPPRALLGLMAEAELLALPSWSEAFGLVYVEALAAGTPVLCTTDSGFWQFAERWAAGGDVVPATAVPPHDAPALRAALDALLADPAAAAREAASGRRMVDAWFSWQRNAEQLLETLGVAAAQRSVSPSTSPSRR